MTSVALLLEIESREQVASTQYLKCSVRGYESTYYKRLQSPLEMNTSTGIVQL